MAVGRLPRGRTIIRLSGPLFIRMRRLVSVSVLKKTVLPSRKNLEMPAGASSRCFSQKANGSRTMSTMPPMTGVKKPAGRGTEVAVRRKESCSKRK